jgi:FAD/FMN-containing dehydrogenase
MYFSRASLQLLAIPFFCHRALAQNAPSPDTSAACLKIAQGSAETVIYPAGLADPDYLDAKNHYWSAANADLTPACVVFPTSANETSYVIKVLLEFPTVQFATKSGGHNTNVGFSSTNWGVLISFSHLNSTTISSNHQTAAVGPGARWENVYSALEPYGRVVVGGRLGKSNHAYDEAG